MQPAALALGDELQRCVRLLPDPFTARLADALQRDLQDLEAHFGQREEALIAVDPVLHVHLRDGVETRAAQRVDEQPGLDAVAGEEGNLLEQCAAAALLARERLDHPGELGKEEVEDRAGRGSRTRTSDAYRSRPCRSTRRGRR